MPPLKKAVADFIGKAQHTYGMTIHGFVVVSNHAHFLLSPTSAHQLARFMQYVNANIAKEVGRLHDWPERVWSRRYRAIPVVDDKAAHARIHYLFNQNTGTALRHFGAPALRGGQRRSIRTLALHFGHFGHFGRAATFRDALGRLGHRALRHVHQQDRLIAAASRE